MAAAKAKKPAKSDAPDYGITQEELIAYRISDTTHKRHQKDRNERHESLKARLLDGATVEPGTLSALIISTDRGAYAVEAGTARSLKVVETASLVP